jgi:hypothetical protein
MGRPEAIPLSLVPAAGIVRVSPSIAVQMLSDIGSLIFCWGAFG